MITILSFFDKYWQGLTVLSTFVLFTYKIVSNHLAHHKNDILGAVQGVKEDVQDFRVETKEKLVEMDGRIDRLEEPFFRDKK